MDRRQATDPASFHPGVLVNGVVALLILERKTRFELATFSLARRCSTTEPLPRGALSDALGL